MAANKYPDRAKVVATYVELGSTACCEKFGLSSTMVLRIIKQDAPHVERKQWRLRLPRANAPFIPKEITGSFLETLFSYDPNEGHFRHLTYRGPRTGGKGSIAGTQGNHGYISIGVCQKLFLAHRLAWLWMTGEWPKSEIDHVNGNRLDNRFCNLRLATRSQQGQNGGKRRNNKSGRIGVCFDESRRLWKAAIMLNGKTVKQKRFQTLAEAVAYREMLEKRYFNEFAPFPRDGWPCR